MIYRTLHSYVLKELLRVFLLTATALTTLMAFGGTFKPLTKQGIEISQLMGILINLMPAMLAYAIPVAALFAAVLVYWRMSTDNELTACRAGGISFMSIVMPAFILGLVVASVDLMFVNYVVPRFLQLTERAVMRDLGSLAVSQIGRQENFKIPDGPFIIGADSAELEPSDDPDVSKLYLRGVAISMLAKGGKAMGTVIAPEAHAEIRNLPLQDASEVIFNLTDATAFDPNNAFRRVSLSLDSRILSGKPFVLPSQLRNKPKYLNLRDLMELTKNPYKFSQVSEIVDHIEAQYDFQVIAQNAQKWWQTKSANGRDPVTFEGREVFAGNTSSYKLYASSVVYDETAAPEQALTFRGKGPGALKLEQWETDKKGQKHLKTTFLCDSALLNLAQDEFSATGVMASLQLQGSITHESSMYPKGLTTSSAAPLPVILPADVTTVPDYSPGNPAGLTKASLVAIADSSPAKNMQVLGTKVHVQIAQLDRTIISELHSRGSFAVSCLTLVMFGAALGILLRGKNPLAVFVVGFVPAIILVLLITAGREVTEGHTNHMTSGIILIWAGNAVLLILVAGVYAKLLRQ